jgi:hypothetical protein
VSDLELSTLIHQVCTVSDETDPDAVAKLVLDRIDPADYADALRQALPYLVRRDFRRYNEPWTVHSMPADEQPAASTPTPPRASSKRARIREAWLADRVRVLDGYKRIGDCTIDDLEHAASERRKHAEATLARAEQLDALIALMREHRATTVRELPADVLTQARDAA